MSCITVFSLYHTSRYIINTSLSNVWGVTGLKLGPTILSGMPVDFCVYGYPFFGGFRVMNVEPFLGFGCL